MRMFVIHTPGTEGGAPPTTSAHKSAYDVLFETDMNAEELDELYDLKTGEELTSAEMDCVIRRVDSEPPPAPDVEHSPNALLTALQLLQECKPHLWHTKCKDEDATKCPACSIEARIDALK